MIELVFNNKTELYTPLQIVEKIFTLYKANSNVVKTGVDRIIGIRNKGNYEVECAKVAELLERYYFGEGAEKVKADILKKL